MNAAWQTKYSGKRMASGDAPERVIHRMAALLESAGIPYMLTGSFASGFHGAPRASQDIDIVIAANLGSLRRFLALLPEEQYYVSRDAALDAYGRESLFNIVEYATGWKIDLIMRKSRSFSVTEFERRTLADLAGVDVYVATAEDVLIAKLEWAKLSQSERQLEDAAGILRVQGEDLDREYVEHWVEAMQLSNEWSAATSKLG
jgi:hypothetical protein